MFRILLMVASVSVFTFCSLAAQDALQSKHTSDDPPKTARLRIGTTRLRETGRMTGIEFLPDGKHVVTTKGPDVHYWNLETGLLVNAHSFKPIVKKFNPRESSGFGFQPIRTNALSPDGKTFAALIQNDVYSAKVDLNGTPAYTIWRKGGFKSPRRVAVGFAKVGVANAVVVLDESGSIQVQEAEKSLSLATGIEDASSFAVAGKWCVVANLAGSLAIVDLEARKRVNGLLEKNIQNVSLSPDGKYLAIYCNRNERVVWDLERNKEVSRGKDEGSSRSVAIAIAGDRILVYREFNHTTELRNWKTDKILHSERGESLQNLAFSHDGKSCTAFGSRGAIYVRDAQSGRLLTPPGYFGPVVALHWPKDGGLWAAGLDATARHWDTKTGIETERFENDRFTGVRSWIFTKDDKSAFCRSLLRGEIRLRDLGTKEQRLIAEPSIVNGRSNSITAMALSPDEKTLAFAEVGITESSSLHLLDLATTKIVTTKVYREYAGATHLSELVFVSNGVLLSKTLDGKVAVWDLNKRKVDRLFEIGYYRTSFGIDVFERLILAPDRKFLVVGGYLDGTAFSKNNTHGIAYWDIETGKRVKHFTIDTPPTATAMSADGKTIVTGDEKGGVHVWDVASTNRILHEPNAHRGAVTAIAIAPDGRSFATGSADTSILVWDIPARK